MRDAEIERLTPLLLELRTADADNSSVSLGENRRFAGDLLQLLANSQGKRYVALVASPKRGNEPVTLRLGSGLRLMCPEMAATQPRPETSESGCVAVSLRPGQGAIYELSPKP